MTRREFTRRIAEDYAAFAADCAAHHPGSTPQPFGREYVFGAGSRIIERGDYVPRRDWRYMDRDSIVREARKQLPAAERLIAQVHDGWEHSCHVCGGTVKA